MDQNDEKTNAYASTEIFDIADKFINLANELYQESQSELIGDSLRYAAARFSVFEASLQTNDLAEDMDNLVESYANDFTNMLRVNFEDYYKRLNP